MRPALVTAFALTVLASVLGTGAKAEDGCRPVDMFAEDPSTLPGRKAWIWADSEVLLRNSRKGVGMTITYLQTGPNRWDRNEEDLLEYGEPVELVKFLDLDPSFKLMKVKRQDGRIAVVNASAVRLYEFWKCSVQQLMGKRSVPTKDGKYPFNVDVQWSHTVWVRLVDKTTPVELNGRWMKPEDVAKMDVMLCRQLFDARYKAPAGLYDLNACQALTLNGYGLGVSLDPKAVELVTPTSMKILVSQ